MAEIVDDGDAARDAAHFHATFDAFKGVERRLDLVILESAMFSTSDHGQGIAHVEFANEVRVKFETGDFKLSSRRPIAQVESLDGVCFAETEAFDGAMSHVEQASEVLIVAIGQQQAVAGNEANEVAEGCFNRIEIRKDI